MTGMPSTTGMMGRTARTWLVALALGVMTAVAAIAVPVTNVFAASAKVQELSRTLLKDSNYKLRVQAALLLGKLGDREALPALTKALSDQNKTVRAMAARSLGQLGDPAALSAIQAVANKDPDSYVRAQAQQAMALIGAAPPTGSASGKPKMYLTFGPFSGGIKSAGPEYTRIVVEVLRRELGKLTAVSIGIPPTGSGAVPGFLIDGNVTRLDDSPVGGSVETSCDVKVFVARHPSKSIILWTSAGAGVQAGSRPQDRANARRECLEATAQQLSEDLRNYFRSQGG